MDNKSSTICENVEVVEAEFPMRFKKLNLRPFGGINILDIVRNQGNKVVLISDSVHKDGDYYYAIVRGGDKEHYYAALLGNDETIEEKKFSYTGLAGLMVSEGEQVFTKEFNIVRYR